MEETHQATLAGVKVFDLYMQRENVPVYRSVSAPSTWQHLTELKGQ